ncbi:MAG: hypothetical protein MUO61_06375, partial [Dehalococcoidia bacterium]|nr:hypothetical protein [Dehalococcoidia bacterium]
MSVKVNGGMVAKNIVKVTNAKALAMKVAAMLNGKLKSKALIARERKEVESLARFNEANSKKRDDLGLQHQHITKAAPAVNSVKAKVVKVAVVKVKDARVLYDHRQLFKTSHGKAIAAEWAKTQHSKTAVVKALKLNSILTTYVLHTLNLTTTKDKHILMLVEADKQFVKGSKAPAKAKAN